MTAPQLVVGGVLIDSLEHPSLVWAARRSRPEALRGMWEFPGGKVESGEAPAVALVRELQEELYVETRVGAELTRRSGPLPISDSYCLRLFFAEVAAGALRPGESHDRVQSLDAESLDTLAWLPADATAIPMVAEALRRGTSVEK